MMRCLQCFIAGMVGRWPFPHYDHPCYWKGQDAVLIAGVAGVVVVIFGAGLIVGAFI